MHRLRSALFAFVFLHAVARADYTTVINPQTTWGTWEGWGASLCWWANVFGTRNDLADLVFTTNYVTLNGQSLPGLGLNIARYNAGGCNTNLISGSSIQFSANMPDFKKIYGYWLNWLSSDPASANWDWSGDANQRTLLQKAKARGANLLELFSNSPMWWMCYNANPSGADNGANDNLQSWNYQTHAVYLATVAKYASDHWGVTFDSVEPFNEPIATWWSVTGTQEGCHFATGTQAAVIGYLRTELDNRGLNSTRVAASDESYYDQATSTWNSFSATNRAQIGEVNVHGYQYGGGRRDLLYSAVAGHRLWNSEYGEGDGTGISLAGNLNLDFRWLHPTAWCYWQPFDSGGWGLIQSNPGDNWIGSANPKYFVLAQYTRHIRPGMTIMDGGEGNTIAAYDAAARKLVLVTMNYITAQNITYNLAGFYKVAGPIRRWMTATGTGVKYAQSSNPSLNSQQFTVAFATNTIQTFEVQNVDLNPPPLLNGKLSSSNNQITLTWPLWTAGYKLYANSNLAVSSGWQLVTNLPSTNTGSFSVSLPSSKPGRQFFRLSNP
jgi:galactan endo-1,6-beta-galactosidase